MTRLSRWFRHLALPLLLAGFSSLACAQAPAGHLERIKAAGELRVCIWPDYYGITFRNPKSGELSGIDEMFQRMAGIS